MRIPLLNGYRFAARVLSVSNCVDRYQCSHVLYLQKKKKKKKNQIKSTLVVGLEFTVWDSILWAPKVLCCVFVPFFF